MHKDQRDSERLVENVSYDTFITIQLGEVYSFLKSYQ